MFLDPRKNVSQVPTSTWLVWCFAGSYHGRTEVQKSLCVYLKESVSDVGKFVFVSESQALKVRI